MGFLKDVVGGIGKGLGAIGKIASPIASFLPGGSLVTGGLGALGSLLGGGGAGGALQGGLAGLLGGKAGGAAGMDPAMMALMSLLGGGQMGESKAQREAAQKQADFRNQMLTRGLGQAEQAWNAQEPMRQMGMGGLSSFFSGEGGPRGIFQTPQTAGDISRQDPTPMGFMANLQSGAPAATGPTGGAEPAFTPPDISDVVNRRRPPAGGGGGSGGSDLDQRGGMRHLPRAL